MTIRTTTVFETEDGKTHKTEGEAVMHALDVIGKDIIKNHSNGSIRAGLLHHSAELIPLLQFVQEKLRKAGDEPDEVKEGDSSPAETIPAIPDEGTLEYNEWTRRVKDEGRQARYEGEPQSSNPYAYNTTARHLWSNGWKGVNLHKECEGGPC